MANPYFQFKQFTVFHDRCAMKVTTDACLFGAWTADRLPLPQPGQRLLDIGTGSGLLSLMVAQRTGWLIDAVEIDADAAAQASDNVSASPWKDRIAILHEDLRHLPNTQLWNGIVCNPPFYENELTSPKAERNTAHHSTQLLLKDVLIFIGNQLTADGHFFLLLPYKRKEEVLALLKETALYPSEIMTVLPSLQHAPFRLMIHGSKQCQEAREKTIAIKDGKGNYTDDFTALLRPYYLHL